jgi:hypothetical protein
VLHVLAGTTCAAAAAVAQEESMQASGELLFVRCMQGNMLQCVAELNQGS